MIHANQSYTCSPCLALPGDTTIKVLAHVPRLPVPPGQPWCFPMCPLPCGMVWRASSSVSNKLAFQRQLPPIYWPHHISIIINKTYILKHMPVYRGAVPPHFQLIIAKQASTQHYRHSEFSREARNPDFIHL